jgi:hypothetical protein
MVEGLVVEAMMEPDQVVVIVLALMIEWPVTGAGVCESRKLAGRMMLGRGWSCSRGPPALERGSAWRRMSVLTTREVGAVGVFREVMIQVCTFALCFCNTSLFFKSGGVN